MEEIIQDFVSRWYSNACLDFGIVEKQGEREDCLYHLANKGKNILKLQELHLHEPNLETEFRVILCKIAKKRLDEKSKKLKAILPRLSQQKMKFLLAYIATKDLDLSATRSKITPRTGEKWLSNICIDKIKRSIKATLF